MDNERLIGYNTNIYKWLKADKRRLSRQLRPRAILSFFIFRPPHSPSEDIYVIWQQSQSPQKPRFNADIDGGGDGGEVDENETSKSESKAHMNKIRTKKTSHPLLLQTSIATKVSNRLRLQIHNHLGVMCGGSEQSFDSSKHKLTLANSQTYVKERAQS